MRLALLAAALLLGSCTQVFLHPGREEVLHPQRLGLAYEDVWIAAPDGARLHAWYLPAAAPARGTVLHLHGNAENISTFIGATHWLPQRGYNVLLLDYRGYGRSEGDPSVAHLHEDAAAALSHLLARGAGSGSPLFVFGQSIGGAVAIRTAAHHPDRARIAAVVTEGAFSGYARIAREKLGALWLTWPLQWPLSLLFASDFDAEDAVGALPMPLLLIHGERDPVVDVSHGRRLYQAARGPRELWIVPGGGHVDAFKHPANRERLLRYFETLASLPSSVTPAAR
jgi:uncharacterized protein